MSDLKMRRKTQGGVALITAILGALLVSLTAATAIGITWRRFELANMRSDRSVGFASAESGLQYAFARLEINDNRQLINRFGTPYGPVGVPFRTRVQSDPDGLLISCDENRPGLDHWERNLHMFTKGPPYVGGKHVAVRIRWNPGGAGGPGRPYEVRAESEFGTGN